MFSKFGCVVLVTLCSFVLAAQTVILEGRYDSGINDPNWTVISGAYTLVNEKTGGIDLTGNYYLDPSLHSTRLVTTEIAAVPENEPIGIQYKVMNTNGGTFVIDSPSGVGLVDANGEGLMFLSQPMLGTKQNIMDIYSTSDFGATKTKLGTFAPVHPSGYAFGSKWYDYRFGWDRVAKKIDFYLQSPFDLNESYIGQLNYISGMPVLFSDNFQDQNYTEEPVWTPMQVSAAVVLEHIDQPGNYVFDSDDHNNRFTTPFTTDMDSLVIEFDMSSNTGTTGGLCPIGLAFTDSTGEGLAFIGAVNRTASGAFNVVKLATTTDNFTTYSEVSVADMALTSYSARKMNSFKFVWDKVTGDIQMYSKNYLDGDYTLMTTVNYNIAQYLDFSNIVLKALHGATYVDNIKITGNSTDVFIDESLTDFDRVIYYVSNQRFNFDELLITAGEPDAVCGDGSHQIPSEDLNGDCTVDLNDLAIFADNWGHNDYPGAAALTIGYLEAEDAETYSINKTQAACSTIRNAEYPDEIYYLSNCQWVVQNAFAYYQYKINSGDLPAGKYYIYVRQNTYNATGRLRLKIAENEYWYTNQFLDKFEFVTAPLLKSAGYGYVNDTDFDMRWVPVTVGEVDDINSPYQLAEFEVKQGNWYSIMMERYYSKYVGYDTIAFVNARYVNEYLEANGELWWPQPILGDGETYMPNIRNQNVPAPSVQCGDSAHPIVNGDLNSDCVVGLADLDIFASSWLACTSPVCD